MPRKGSGEGRSRVDRHASSAPHETQSPVVCLGSCVSASQGIDSVTVCVLCAAGPFSEWFSACPRCGEPSLRWTAARVNGRAYGEAGHAHVARPRRGVVLMSTLEAEGSRVHRVPWGFSALRLPVSSSLMVFGPPGGGKSTLATTAALALSHAGTPVLYLSAEEGHADTAVERFSRCSRALGLRRTPSSLAISDARSPDEASTDVERWLADRRDALLVVDSASELRASPTWLEGLLARPRLGLLVVQHVTTGGLPRGGLEPAFAVDVTVRCAGLVAQVTKNRWGACEEFSVSAPLVSDEGKDVTGKVLPFRGAP